MALVRNDYCNHCEKDTQHVNWHCSVCARREERERIALWNALPTDEKLQDLRKRLERIEAGPIRY